MASPNTIVIGGNDANDEVSLLDVLDHVLNQGVVIRGNLVISLAGVDLVYIGLDVILTSIETALRHMDTVASCDLPTLHRKR
ncbi:MAG TPA: gas vesicle protein [Terriglobales bacterium]|nr:gas vesicle protein [Terriglobales bacterium]